MDRLQGYGWLIVGGALALAVPIFAVDRWLLNLLTSAVPLPWGRLALGALIFVACTSFYFRSHWIATMRRLTQEVERVARERDRAHDIAGDTERIAGLIRDNLEEVRIPNTTSPDAPAALYLDGARAHAGKLLEVRDRILALGMRLGPDAEDRGR